MENRYYVVKQGDSLWGIAKHFGYSIQQLAERNGLTGKRMNLISIGQRIYFPGNDSSPDLTLNVQLIGLNSKSLRQVNVELEYDTIITETKTDDDGWLHKLDIQDHAKGLKISFENYEGKWQTVFDEKRLPPGDKILKVNVMTDLVKGRTFRKDGSMIMADKQIGSEVRNKTPQPAVATRPRKQLPDVPAAPILMETRTSNGIPIVINAPLFSDENLYLPKGNEKFRKAIIEAARKYNLTPHALAAIINAEAAKTKDGTWIETSATDGSKARGLGQFQPPAWYQYVAKAGTLGNVAAIAITGVTKLEAAHGTLYSVSGTSKVEVSGSLKTEILSWRDNGNYSVDAIGSYAEDNLNELKKNGIDVTGLPPDEKVKIAYIMHHEGPTDGVLFLQGKVGMTETSTPRIVAKKLAKQFKTKHADGSAKAQELADRFDGDYVKAYYYFLSNHTDVMVRVKNFMLSSNGFSEKPVDKVIHSITGFKVEKPRERKTPDQSNPKQVEKEDQHPAERELSPADGVGGIPKWSDPLDRCTIRIGGYSESTNNPASARSKSLFGGRGGKHKGIDLCAVPGTPIKAVANGAIHYAGPAGSYGNVIVLKVNINDLPEAQRRHALNIPGIQNDTLYFLYAHLSSINVTHRPPNLPHAGQIIGKSGDTGNAKGMIEVGQGNDLKYGAHLHFEVRLNSSLKKGEGRWCDPLPFLTQCK